MGTFAVDTQGRFVLMLGEKKQLNDSQWTDQAQTLTLLQANVIL